MTSYRTISLLLLSFLVADETVAENLNRHLEERFSTLQDDTCVDSPLRIKFQFNDRLIARSCEWISNKPYRCSIIQGAGPSCPATCQDDCSSCTDSPNRFRISIKGINRWRDCKWVKNKATAWRCLTYEGVAETCRATCQTGVCVATSPSPSISPAPTSLAPTSTCGNGIYEPELGEECDDGIYNGQNWISDCDDSCAFVNNPSGCCLSANQCLNDIKESDPNCLFGSFKRFGVCGEFSSCPYNTPTEPLCSTPAACEIDSVCVNSSCNTDTDVCEYSIKSGYNIVNGECLASECSGSSPPCPAGEIHSSENCCELCPVGTYELNGACIDCPDNTTTVEGSTGIESCVELFQCPSVAPSIFPSDFPSSTPSSYPSTTPTSSKGPAGAPTRHPSPAPSPFPTARPSKAPSTAPSQQNANDSKDENFDRNLPSDIHSRIFGICSDLCTTLNARRGNLSLVSWNLKYYRSDVNPDTLQGLVDAANLLSKMSTLANIANTGAALTQGATAVALEASKAIIDELGSSNLATAALNGALALNKIIIKRDGMAIWIKLSGSCCKRVSCCIVASRKDWADVERWHKCSAQPRAGVALMQGFFPGDLTGIIRAIPGCIMEASRAFKC